MEPAAYVVAAAQGRRAEVRRRGPRARGQPPAGAEPVAGQPARLLGQGQRVLPAAPARHRQRRDRPGGAAGQAAARRDVGRPGARGQARPADDHRLPDDQLDDPVRRRAARGDVVREARPQHHRHAPVHPLLQPRDRAAVADQDRLGGVEDDRPALLRARGRPPRHPPGRGRQAAVARHPRGDGHRARRGQGLAGRRGRAGPGQDDAGAGGGRARLHRDLREDDVDRPADGDRRHAHQGRGLRRQARDGHPAQSQRRDPRRSRRRAAQGRDRHPDGRRDPAPVRRLQRSPGHAGLPLPGEAHRHRARRPGRRARGQADHLRRHPGRARAGDHLAGVVGLGERRPALQPVHHQHRAWQAVPHPHRSAAVLRRPRLVPGHGRGAAGLPATARHDLAVRRAGDRRDRASSGVVRCAT